MTHILSSRSSRFRRQKLTWRKRQDEKAKAEQGQCGELFNREAHSQVVGQVTAENKSRDNAGSEFQKESRREDTGEEHRERYVGRTDLVWTEGGAGGNLRSFIFPKASFSNQGVAPCWS